METTTTVLTVMTAVIFAAGGIAALAAVPALSDNWEQLRVSDTLGRATGALEIAAAIGLIISLWTAPGLGLAAAAGLALLTVGAIVYHGRIGDTTGLIPPAVLGSLAVVTAAFIANTGL